MKIFSLALAACLCAAQAKAAEAPRSHLPQASDLAVTDLFCKFENDPHAAAEGGRLAVCILIYEDGSESAYWHPVSISDSGIVTPLPLPLVAQKGAAQ